MGRIITTQWGRFHNTACTCHRTPGAVHSQQLPSLLLELAEEPSVSRSDVCHLRPNTRVALAGPCGPWDPCDYAVGLLDCGYTSQSLGHQRSGTGTDLGSSSLGFMFGSSRPWPAGRSSCSLSATISKVISSLPCGNRGTWSGAHGLCPMAWRRARPGQT